MILKTHRSDKQRTADHDYRGYLERLRRQGCFFLVPRRYLTVFKHRTACFLLSTLNAFQAKHSEDGYCQLTPKFVRDGIGLSYATQEVILEDLTRLGIVEIQKRGDPRTRHVRIDVARLEEVLSRGAGLHKVA